MGYGVGGAIGGGVFALVQLLGPRLLPEPPLVRWAFLYVLLGGVSASVWAAATRWATARISLSRREAVAASALLAGTLLGAIALLGATLVRGAGDGPLLLGLPWADGVGGFLAGAVGGALWHAATRASSTSAANHCALSICAVADPSMYASDRRRREPTATKGRPQPPGPKNPAGHKRPYRYANKFAKPDSCRRLSTVSSYRGNDLRTFSRIGKGYAERRPAVSAHAHPGRGSPQSIGAGPTPACTAAFAGFSVIRRA